jgi:type III pantothenate kinase
MKLIIDIGNTRVKTALFDHDDMAELVTDKDISVASLEKIFGKYDNISASILASVRETDRNVIDYLAEKTQLLQLDSKTPLPFTNKYATPETLGHDRVAAVAGASTLFPGRNVLVIDAGSCITYDLITSGNEYLGGGISPGINMRFSAMHTFTGKLPLISFRAGEQPALIGTDTESSILSGVQNGVLLEVDGIINAYKAKFQELKVVVGGGDYKYFDKYLKNNIFASPNIVLAGLNRILDFNEES